MSVWYPITGRIARRLAGDVRRAKAVGAHADPRLRGEARAKAVDQAQRTEEAAAARGAEVARDPVGDLLALAGRTVTRDDLVVRYPRTSNNSIEPLNDGPRAFAAIFEDMRAEDGSIHIVQFGFQDPLMAELLIEKAEAGVDVRLALDAKGSKVYGELRGQFERMAAAGIQTTTNDGLSLFDRDGIVGRRGRPHLSHLDELGHWEHRKLFVLGGHTAYTGGMGNEGHFLNGKQHDVMYRINGDVVHHMQHAMLAGFMFLAGPGFLPADRAQIESYFPDTEHVPEGERTKSRPYFGYPDGAHSPLGDSFESTVFGGVDLQVVQNIPGTHWLETTETYMELCRTAERSLDLMTPYFGDPRLEGELAAAARRIGSAGRVRVFIPGHNETPMCDATQRNAYRKLEQAGVDVREYTTKSKRDPPEESGRPNMLHAKLVVADGTRASVGTCNHDGMSLYQMFELNINVHDQRFAAWVTGMLDRDESSHALDAVPPRGLKALLAKVVSLYERLWEPHWHDKPIDLGPGPTPVPKSR